MDDLQVEDKYILFLELYLDPQQNSSPGPQATYVSNPSSTLLPGARGNPSNSTPGMTSNLVPASTPLRIPGYRGKHHRKTGTMDTGRACSAW